MAVDNVKVSMVKTEQQSSSKITLLSLAVTMLLPTMGVSIINVALPNLVESFNVPLSAVNWMVIAYLIAITCFVVSAGALGDRFGRKRLLLSGIGLFLVSSLVCATSTQLWILIILRFVQGIASALILSQTLAIASTATHGKQTGAAMGLMGTMAATGTALGPAVGGLVVETMGWQWIFWLMLFIAGASFLLCKYLVNEERQEKPAAGRFDVVGTLLLSLACFLYALSMTSDAPLFSIRSIVFFFASAAVCGVFIRHQRHHCAPLIALRFFRYPLRNVTLLANVIVDTVAMATLVVGPFYLTYALELPPVILGLLMATGPVIASFCGFPAGKLVDAIGVRTVMLSGLALMAIGALCFAFLPVQWEVYGYIAALIILTPGRQLFLAANHTFVMQSAEAADKGRVAGILNLTKNLGLMTGASLMGGVFAFNLDSANPAAASRQQLDQAFTNSFILASTMLVLVFLLICMVLFGRQSRASPPDK